jgi:hypothetical protein
MNYFPQRLKSVHKRLLHLFCFVVAMVWLPVLYLCAGSVVIRLPNFVEGVQPAPFEMQSESHSGFKHIAASVVKQNSQNLTFGSSQNSTINQRNEFGFFGIDTGAAIPTASEFVSGKRGNQSADNASSNKPRNVYDWIYFFAHEILKIVLCGAIGGVFAIYIVETWLARIGSKTLFGFIDAPLFTNGKDTGRTVRFKTKTTVSL